MPSTRDPLHHLNMLSFIAEEIHRDLKAKNPGRLDARTMAGNQQMAQDAAFTLMRRAVAALIDIAELGSSVDLPKRIEDSIREGLNDAWDDATTEAWERTREAAEEESRGVAA